MKESAASRVLVFNGEMIVYGLLTFFATASRQGESRRHTKGLKSLDARLSESGPEGAGADAYDAKTSSPDA